MVGQVFFLTVFVKFRESRFENEMTVDAGKL